MSDFAAPRRVGKVNIDTLLLLYVTISLIASLGCCVLAPSTLTGIVLGILACALAVAVSHRPMLGVFLLVVTHATGVFSFELTTAGNAAVTYFRPHEIIVLLLIPALIASRRTEPRKITDSPSVNLVLQWGTLMLCSLALWGIVCTLGAERLVPAAIGWWKLCANFIMIFYLIRFVDSEAKLLRTMRWYCGVAVLFALGALVTTYYAAEYIAVILSSESFSLSARCTLFNTSSGFNAAVCGLKAGVGLAGKHEVVMVLVAAQIFLVCHFKRNQTRMEHFFLILLLILFETVKYQLVAKTAILGCFLVLIFVCLVSSTLRRRFITVLALYCILNLAGFGLAYLIRPAHMKRMESFAASIQTQVQSKSAYEPGSFSYRVNTWKKTLHRIESAPVFGLGPDGLWHSMSFGDPHGHNLFLTTAAEYGIPGAALMFAAVMLLCFTAVQITAHAFERSSRHGLSSICTVGAVLFCMIEYSIDNFIYWPDIWFKSGLLLCCVRIFAGPHRPTPHPSPPFMSSTTP